MPIRPSFTEGTDAAASVSTSYSVSVGQSLQGTIRTNADHDWYAVTLVAGQTYTFAQIGTGTNALEDTYLTLHNSAGATLLTDDDSGPGSSSLITYTAPTTGTYYIDAGAYPDGRSVGQYGLSITAGTRASFDILMGAGAIDAHDNWNSRGTALTISYGFRQSPASYTVSGSNISTFTQVSPAEMAAVQAILQQWGEVANINFVQVNPGGYTDNATILIGNYNDSSDGAGAFAFYPGSTAASSSAGDLWLNLGGGVSTTSIPVGSYTYMAIMHELGHALGLSHPGDYNAAPGQTITYANNAQFIQDSEQYSVMSYFGGSATGENPGGFGTAYTPMMFDIYEMQALYGANTNTRSGNTVYGFATNAGSIYSFSTGSKPAYAIWDGGGIDTINASGYSQAQIINLGEGTFSSIGGGANNISIALGVTIENATGGSGSDTITGNAAANALIGGAGADILNGLGGADILTGGLGADDFLFDLIALADALSAIFDEVKDYDQGGGSYSFAEGDQFDLSAVLSAAYNHGSGQPVSSLVRVVANGSDAKLQIDQDGAANGVNWVTIATIDGLHAGQSVNVIVDSAAPAGVNLTVISSNQPPTITSSGGGDTATLLVAENLTAVTTVAATDPDGNTLSYSLTGGADLQKFHIDAVTGALSFVSAPDYENPTDSDHNNSYVVQVSVSDGTVTDNQIITVNVTDVAPAFTGDAGNNVLTGTAENDTLTGLAGADTLTGRGGPDKFVFEATALADAQTDTPVADRITDYDQGNSGTYSAAEGDVIDVSAILSAAYDHGNGAPVDSLVRAIDDGSGSTQFQVNPDGTKWLTLAALTNIHAGNTIDVVLDPTQAPVHIQSFSTATQTVNNPNGTTTITNFDTNDSQPWWQDIVTTDSGGALLQETFKEDDGSSWTNTYDPHNTSSVSWVTDHFDSHGALVSEVKGNDDGTHTLDVYDTANSQPWSHIAIAFDANWMMTSMNGTRDGGAAMSANEVGAAYDTVTFFARPVDPSHDLLIV